MNREPYERDGRIIIEDPYVSEFGTEETMPVGLCARCGRWVCRCDEDVDLHARLAELRRQAAVRCGLEQYPADLVESFEAINASAAAWGHMHPDRQQRLLSMNAAARQALRLAAVSGYLYRGSPE